MVEHNLLGEALATMTEAFLNFMMLSICFVDVIFAGLVKLRLFNGYMSDDVVLTRFCLLHGYAQDLNRQFTEGASQMKKQMSMEVGDVNFDQKGEKKSIEDKPRGAPNNNPRNAPQKNETAHAAGLQAAPAQKNETAHHAQPGSGRGAQQQPNGQGSATGGLYGSGLAAVPAEQPAQQGMSRRAERSNSRAERGDRTKSMPQKNAESDEHVAFLKEMEREQKPDAAAEKKKPSEAM